MDRRGLLALTVAALGAAATLTVGSRSNGQQADADGVRSAIDRFHAALGTLDVRNVDEFWVHDGEVVTINPRDKTFAVGWDAVRQSYQETFGFWSELAVAQKDAAHIRVNGAVAWVEGITVANLVKHLPTTEIQAILEGVLSSAHANKPFGEQELLDAVPSKQLVEHLPLTMIWDSVVNPQVAARNGLVTGGTESVATPSNGRNDGSSWNKNDNNKDESSSDDDKVYYAA